MEREEALQAIKEKMDYYESDKRLRGAIETLVPELRESEDERIIRLLRELGSLDAAKELYKEFDLSYTDVLYWLEKQKERGPLTKEEEYTLHRIIEYLEDETCPSEWISLLHGIYCLPYGKQKENVEKEYVFRPLGGTDITVAAEQAIKRVNEGERLVLAFNGVYIPVIKGYDANEIVDIYNTFVEKRKEPPFVKDVNIGYPGHYFYDGERMYLCSSPALEEKQKEQKSAKLTSLATQLSDYLKNDFEYFATKKWDEKKWNEVMNIQASELLRIAQNELKKEQNSVECIEFTNEFENQVSHLLASVLNGEWEYNEGFVKHAAQSLLGYAKNEMKPDEWNKREKLFTKALQTANARIGQLFEENKKLKEQKPVPFSRSHENGQPADPVFSKQEYESHPIISTDTTSTKPVEFDGKALLYTADKSYQIGFRDGVASVKPAEWSESDKGILMDAICATEKLGDNEIYNKNNPNLAKAFRVAKDWLKNLPERFNLQPKQEWSEEDEGELQNAIDALEFLGKKGVYKSESGYDAALQAASWLKSLRPSWKPSEHQMNILKAVKDYVGKGSGYWGEGLGSLIDDLEKLM